MRMSDGSEGSSSSFKEDWAGHNADDIMGMITLWLVNGASNTVLMIVQQVLVFPTALKTLFFKH